MIGPTPETAAMSRLGLVLAGTIAASAWLSQAPYFFWSHRELGLAAGALAAGAAALAALWARSLRQLSRRDIAAGTGLVVFLLYITGQRTVAGGHTLWLFAVPSVIAILIASQPERRLAYDWFELVFVVSLVPGLILLALMIAGVPLVFSVRPALNPLFANNGVRVLQGMGAVFIESNSQPLPWGGTISRLCGMYDEPGMVGTVAALMLAVRGFDVRGWRAWLLWTAGVCSLSLAFVVLTLVGLAFRIATRPQWRPLALSLPVLLAGLFTIGIVHVPQRAAAVAAPPRVRVTTPNDGIKPARLGTEVRETKVLNNRSLPPMDALVARYKRSGWQTIVFGIASDASVVYGGASAVWTRVLTNHGVLGFVLLVGSFLGYGLSSVPRAANRSTMLLAILCFSLSFYQRPVIWMPYALLLFFGGLAMIERRVSQPV
jgi:hypothetical protein